MWQTTTTPEQTYDDLADAIYRLRYALDDVPPETADEVTLDQARQHVEQALNLLKS